MTPFEQMVEDLMLKRQRLCKSNISELRYPAPPSGGPSSAGGAGATDDSLNQRCVLCGPLVGVEEEENEPGVGSEEAAQPVVKRDPRCPSAQERAEHELTHLPFRIWCKACVEGRLENRPHPIAQREHDVPTVLMDYAFVSKEDEQRSTTLLVMKDRESRT